MAAKPGSGSKSSLPPLLQDFGKDDQRRDAAAAEYGQQFAGLDLDALDVGLDDDPVEMAKKASGKPAGKPGPKVEVEPQLEPEPRHRPADEVSDPGSDLAPRPNLEPVGDDAHPPQNRRMPTQPPSSLVLKLDVDDDDRPSRATSPEPAHRPASRPHVGPRQSPAPVRRGLFSTDRITNLLAGAAIGLLLLIFPAKKLAHSYEVREVEPLLADLHGAIEHPLGVEAGLVEGPEVVAAKLHAGRKKTRRRYAAIWLLAGLPLGLALGLAPRPGD